MLLHYFSFLPAQILAVAFSAFDSRRSVSGAAIAANLHMEPVLLCNSLLERIGDRHGVYNSQTYVSHTTQTNNLFHAQSRGGEGGRYLPNFSANSLATSLGFSATFTPAFSNASILLAAVPLLPIMMAPACPIRFPGGAVLPATKATTGLE